MKDLKLILGYIVGLALYFLFWLMVISCSLFFSVGVGIGIGIGIEFSHGPSGKFNLKPFDSNPDSDPD